MGAALSSGHCPCLSSAKGIEGRSFPPLPPAPASRIRQQCITPAAEQPTAPWRWSWAFDSRSFSALCLMTCDQREPEMSETWRRRHKVRENLQDKEADDSSLPAPSSASLAPSSPQTTWLSQNSALSCIPEVLFIYTDLMTLFFSAAGHLFY